MAVATGVGKLAVADPGPGVDIDCGVPIPTGVRPRNWLGLGFCGGIGTVGGRAGFTPSRGVPLRAGTFVIAADVGVGDRPAGVPTAANGVWPCALASFLSSFRFFLSSRA